MSFRRTTYDGSNNGGSVGIKERRNSFDNKDKISEPAPPKRARRDLRLLDNDDSAFNDAADKDRYLITYADLITLLLGLFIILYAMSNIDIEKYEKMIFAMGNIFGTSSGMTYIHDVPVQNSNIVTPIDGLKGKLQNVISENNLNDDITLVENERGITVRILDKILFQSGKAELSEESRNILGKISVILNQFENEIRVEGHTDNVPINTSQYPSNWHLSVQRATNTAYHLMMNEGIDPDRVSIVGFSEYQPVAPNDSPELRSLNRRVDIIILKN